MVRIRIADEVTPKLVDSYKKLIPQLSTSSLPPTEEELEVPLPNRTITRGSRTAVSLHVRSQPNKENKNTIKNKLVFFIS